MHLIKSISGIFLTSLLSTHTFAQEIAYPSIDAIHQAKFVRASRDSLGMWSVFSDPLISEGKKWNVRLNFVPYDQQNNITADKVIKQTQGFFKNLMLLKGVPHAEQQDKVSCSYMTMMFGFYVAAFTPPV